MLAFATRQLNLDEHQRVYFLSVAAKVLAKAAAQEVYAAQNYLPTNPEEIYNVGMGHVVLQSRGIDSRVAAKNAQANIKLGEDLIQVLAELEEQQGVL